MLFALPFDALWPLMMMPRLLFARCHVMPAAPFFFISRRYADADACLRCRHLFSVDFACLSIFSRSLFMIAAVFATLFLMPRHAFFACRRFLCIDILRLMPPLFLRQRYAICLLAVDICFYDAQRSV